MVDDAVIIIDESNGENGYRIVDLETAGDN